MTGEVTRFGFAAGSEAEPEPSARAEAFFLLACLICDPPLPMPFSSPSERGRWAAGHTEGTGHAKWHVWEETRAA